MPHHPDIFPRTPPYAPDETDALPHLFDIWRFDTPPKYEHAKRYIQLRYQGVHQRNSTDDAQRVITALPDGTPTNHRADDILRACRLQPAPQEDPLVREHLSHIEHRKLKPIILIVFADARHPPDIVDGYHRLSVAWWCDAQIPTPVWRVTIPPLHP
jgi:hypothetical protein